VNERGAFAGTQTALRDRLGVDEGAKFVVGGGRLTCLVVAEQLPGGLLVEVKLAGYDGVVGECGALP